MYGEIFDWLLMLYEAFEWKDFEIFLMGQGVLQMSQIPRSYVIVSWRY